MRLAARMTTGYDVRQDRMCLSVLDQHRRPIRIWLTQRLAGRVVAALLARLRTAPNPSSPANPQPAAASRARPRPRAVPPVTGGSEDCLPTRAQIRSGKDGLLLIFQWPGAGSQSIAVPLDAPRLRQWLRSFYTHYQRAGWPLDVWPRPPEQDINSRPPGASLH